MVATLVGACGEAGSDGKRGAAPGLDAAEPFSRVLVVGMDGLEWSVLQPLIAQGRCPNMADLMKRGVFGRLGTMRPTWSPVVWTTIATGKTMKQHGIGGFVDNNNNVYTSGRRHGRALWDIADQYGLRSAVVGWWTTWPVSQNNGLMISGTNASAQLNVNWKPALMPGVDGQVHPPELQDRVYEVAAEAGGRDAIFERARSIFATQIADLPKPERKAVDESLWSIQADATYAALAAEFFDDEPYDLSMVYLGGTDVVGHRFWRQLHPEEFNWQGSSPELDAALACSLPRYYEWADELLGDILAAAGDDVAVMLLSDHGMHADPGSVTDSRFPTTGNHQDGTPGVIIAAGRGIRKAEGEYERFVESGAIANRGNIFDVTPTVLGLLGIPGARNMTQRVPQRKWLNGKAWEFVQELELVDSHDVGFREASMVLASSEANASFNERMIDQLGYAGGDAEGDSVLVNPEDFDPAVGASACR
ncbi:MAG: hypothetical protein DHS20C15_06990 [Planctomycetota bacterium]|nr:MAG: hypothetical protein DHS20C15_06990 [Planctomycetota bacterium]